MCRFLYERMQMISLVGFKGSIAVVVACTIFLTIFTYNRLNLTDVYIAIVHNLGQPKNEKSGKPVNESTTISLPRVVIPTSVNQRVTFRCKTAHLLNIKFPVCIYHVKIDNLISRVIQQGRYYERPAIIGCLKLLLSDMRLQFVDIGANIGLWSLPAARISHVISVEPNWNSISRLAKSVELGAVSSNITLIHNAVSNVRMTVRMGVFKTNQGIAFLRYTDNCQGTRLAAGSPCRTLPPTKTIILNDLLPLMRSKRALMKVDAEGHEINIFTNSTAGEFFHTIDVPVVFMEWVLCKRYSADIVHRLLNFFYSRNYSAFDGHNSKLTSHYMLWPVDVIFKKYHTCTFRKPENTHIMILLYFILFCVA